MTTLSPDCIPLDEVAARLDVHIDRLYAALASGEVPAVRIGSRWRVPRAAFERWWATAGGKVPLELPKQRRARRYRVVHNRGDRRAQPATVTQMRAGGR